MKRLSYLLSLLFLMNLTLFTACKDDDQPGPDPKTDEEVKTEQLTSGAFTVQEVTKGGENVTPATKPTITFNSNGTYQITGELPTPQGATLGSSGEWKFTDTTNWGITLIPTGSEAVQLTSVTLTDSNLNFTYQGAGLKPSDPAVPVVVKATR